MMVQDITPELLVSLSLTLTFHDRLSIENLKCDIDETLLDCNPIQSDDILPDIYWH